MKPMNANVKKDPKFALNMKKLIKSLRPYYLPIILSTIFVTIGTVLAIIAPQYLSDLTNTITDGAASRNVNMDAIFKFGMILVIFYVTNAILTYVSGYIMTIVTQKYSYDMRKNISKKINRLPLKYFDSHPYGDTLSRVTNDVDQIGQSLQQSVTMLIQSVFMLVGVLIAMFITSWQMALTALLTVPLMALFILLIMKVAMPLFKKRQDTLGVVNGIVEENFTGQLIIKAFNAEKRKKAEFEKSNQKLHWTMFKAQFFGGLMQPLMMFISYFAYAAVCVVGGLLLNDGGIVTFGTISAFLVYVNLFQNPLSQIAQSMNSLQMAAAASGRVFEFVEEEEIISEEDKKHFFLEEGVEKVRGKVEFKNVCFGYSPDKIIIPSFSALVNPGMKVAIVGPTGAGKTTMVNLLMRFYELNGGDILIDDKSISEMSREEIHDIFGMVLQDTWMFEGTIRENIVYSTKNVSEEKLIEACKEANIMHYIQTLPGGLDYQISDDASISGGQKQLITIARAMVEDAPLLILDEATSNVDTRTEELIQKAMDQLTEGRTSFVIAHRLSTIKNADLILVMKDGNIIESGNHNQLMDKDGFYASLYNSQFEL